MTRSRSLRAILTTLALVLVAGLGPVLLIGGSAGSLQWSAVPLGTLLALAHLCALALVLQAVPFTIAHLGKPELETLSCMFGGSALGYVAWRTRSFIYPFLIHWFLSTFTLLVASGALG